MECDEPINKQVGCLIVLAVVFSLISGVVLGVNYVNENEAFNGLALICCLGFGAAVFLLIGGAWLRGIYQDFKEGAYHVYIDIPPCYPRQQPALFSKDKSPAGFYFWLFVASMTASMIILIGLGMLFLLWKIVWISA